AVVNRADAARQHARSEFRTHTPRTRRVVRDAVGAARTFQSQMRMRGRTRNRSYADRARRSGRAYARRFPRTSRGYAQANAAEQTAAATAVEIENREQDLLESIDEITESLPDEIQEQGGEAVSQINSEGLPGLIASIDRQEQAVLRALETQYERAQVSLERLRYAIGAELSGMRERALHRLRANADRAMGEIEGGLAAALDQIGTAEARALRPLRTHARDGAALLREATEPDVEAARATADEIIAFLNE